MDKMFIEVDTQRLTMAMLLLSFGLGALFFLLLWPNVLIGFLIGAAVTVGGWSVPKLVVTSLWESRCDKVVDQMVDGLTIMSNGVKAGLSLPQSMQRVCDNMSGPLNQEFGMVLNKTRLGMSIEEALNEMAERIPRQDVQMFVTAINILKETGGNIAETFSTIVTTIRERQKLQKKISAMTAQGTMQAIIISMVPFAILIVFLIVDPAYVEPLLTTPLGWFCLFLVVALQVIGGVFMKKIVTINV